MGSVQYSINVRMSMSMSISISALMSCPYPYWHKGDFFDHFAPDSFSVQQTTSPTDDLATGHTNAKLISSIAVSIPWNPGRSGRFSRFEALRPRTSRVPRRTPLGQMLIFASVIAADLESSRKVFESPKKSGDTFVCAASP